MIILTFCERKSESMQVCELRRIWYQGSCRMLLWGIFLSLCRRCWCTQPPRSSVLILVSLYQSYSQAKNTKDRIDHFTNINTCTHNNRVNRRQQAAVSFLVAEDSSLGGAAILLVIPMVHGCLHATIVTHSPPHAINGGCVFVDFLT